MVVFFGCPGAREDEPRASPLSVPSVPYGTVMADVARRFEQLGRASVAGRFELAEYQRGEIAEQFEEVLPRAVPPRDGQLDLLAAMAKDFRRGNLVELRRALEAHDRARAEVAFARAATACNSCHRASGHGFIEVPAQIGHPIPSTEPVAP